MDLNIKERSIFFSKENKTNNETNLSTLSPVLNNRSKTESIAIGENEIKSILNSGFIVKNDETFLCNTYGLVDNDIKKIITIYLLKTIL